MTDNNFGISGDEFEKLVLELKNGNEAIFEKIFLSQFEISIIYLMGKYKATREVSYDVCMDSLLYFRRLLLNDKIHYGNLRALFYQISSQQYLKHIKKLSRIQLTKNLPVTAIENPENQEENLKLLNKAWDRLGEECKYILKSFYYDNLKLYDVAENLNKTAAALRKQKERCINALRLNFR